MESGKIYRQDEIQAIWKQFHYNPSSVVWSDDRGATWNEVPSMDTGKWPMFSIKNGEKVDWIFKTK